MKIAIIFATVVLGALAQPFTKEAVNQWSAFKKTHQKSYGVVEDLQRFITFNDNLRKIQEHNAKYEKGEVTYFMAINQFADWTTKEFVEYLNLHPRPKHNSSSQKFQSPIGYAAPETVDWRDQGAVTGVKNQGQCGSCWAFSTTGSLEGQNLLKNGNLVSLSEQELVDCSKEHDNSGCAGGFMESGFEYVMKNGLTTEEEYPYEAVDRPCRRGTRSTAVEATSYVEVPSDEEELKSAVALIGPISVAIDASYWHLYGGGIFLDVLCGNTEEALNHGVLAVGYGTENGQDYWLIKNSWGATWGESGYIKQARNANNNCGIATDTSYPIVA